MRKLRRVTIFVQFLTFEFKVTFIQVRGLVSYKFRLNPLFPTLEIDLPSQEYASFYPFVRWVRAFDFVI